MSWWCFLPVSLLRVCWVSCICRLIVFIKFRKVIAIICSNIFCLWLLPVFSPLGLIYILNHLQLFRRPLMLCYWVLLSLFSFQIIFIAVYSDSQIFFSVISNQLLITSSVLGIFHFFNLKHCHLYSLELWAGSLKNASHVSTSLLNTWNIFVISFNVLLW